MKWEKYQENFIKKAREHGLGEDYYQSWLEYAYKLHSNNLPIIYDQSHLARLVGYKLHYLLKVSNSSRHFYREFYIDKKNGSSRKINEPLPNLKQIQSWILNEILYNCSVSEFTKAYRKNKSIKDNAKFHRRQEKVLNTDIEDFFESISFSKVYSFFSSLGYNRPVSTLLTNLCCHRGSLPQGAITSPALSNLVNYELDNKISRYCLKRNLRYTRYADDITISGDFENYKLIKFLDKTLKQNNFVINKNKTRVKLSHQQQRVTGVIVNKKLQAPRTMRRDLRKELHFIKKFGIDSHINFVGYKGDREKYLKSLLGKAYFVTHLNPQDEEVKEYIKVLKQLLKQISISNK
jgi:RNA-directed DNA polymerase